MQKLFHVQQVKKWTFKLQDRHLHNWHSSTDAGGKAELTWTHRILMFSLLLHKSVKHNSSLFVPQVFAAQSGVRPQLSLRLCRGARRLQSELPCDWPILWGSAASSNNELWEVLAHPVHLGWLQQLWWLCSYFSAEFRQVQPLLVMWITFTYTLYIHNGYNIDKIIETDDSIMQSTVASRWMLTFKSWVSERYC